MVSYDEEERIYHKGFRDGWIASRQNPEGVLAPARRPTPGERARRSSSFLDENEPKKPRRKSAKQKLLQSLTDRKWKSYKRKYPKGKKTWVKIRAEVSRSMAYKKKAKRL